nr:pre-mRNA-processing factor 39-like [Anolis sagrei ordinatus]
MAAEGSEGPGSPGSGAMAAAAGESEEAAAGPEAVAVAVEELPSKLPSSNGAPKPPEEEEEVAPVPAPLDEGCNGSSGEATAVVATATACPLLMPEPMKEEVSMAVPELVTHLAQNPPQEDLSITYPLDFERYWRAAQDNPLDFTAWTDLLQYVEQENHIYAARKAFDSFFLRYPYCYGYWKKYADMERRFDFIKETEEVFQRGLQSIPLSMDLWIHYISFLQSSLDMNHPDSAQKICGNHIYAARKAFDSFFLRYPYCYGYWKKYADMERRFDFIKETEEVCDLFSPGFQGPVDEDKILEMSLSIRQQIFSQNEAEVSKRWNFEDGIKRPYFHVKPLERAQLRNWREYLDFEIASGSHERTIVLFERCVIACALYEEFWIKYTRYLESHSVAGARNVFQRACCYHLPRKPTIHLLWAAFEEKHGEVEEARRILRTFEECVPGLAMVRLRRVSLERRQGNMEGAEALLAAAIRENEGLPVSSFYSVKLARQVLKVQKNIAKARKILLEALEKDPDNAKLYANLLEMEFSADVRQNEGHTMSSFDRALTSGLPLETKIIFSQRRVEFLEDFGSSIHSLLVSYDEHQKLLNQQMLRKRLLENGSAEELDEKRLRLEEAGGGSLAVATTGITPLMAADVANSATGSAYNYNAWYQNYSNYGYQNAWNYNQYYQQQT